MVCMTSGLRRNLGLSCTHYSGSQGKRLEREFEYPDGTHIVRTSPSPPRIFNYHTTQSLFRLLSFILTCGLRVFS